MLASIPASILNHIRRRTGIPPDSIKPGNALESENSNSLPEDTGSNPLTAAHGACKRPSRETMAGNYLNARGPRTTTIRFWT
ncbi:MAG: hypothetical protein WB839_09025, partial [Pseudolabrys sp.]